MIEACLPASPISFRSRTKPFSNNNAHGPVEDERDGIALSRDPTDFGPVVPLRRELGHVPPSHNINLPGPVPSHLHYPCPVLSRGPVMSPGNNLV